MDAAAALRVSLAELADPRRFTEPLDLDNEPSDRLHRWLRRMLEIRLAEEAVARLIETGEAKCPCHLGVGQEAVAVGVSAHLDGNDRVYGGHRSHSHFLALGGDMFGMFAEILGRADGVSRGMGGSMHLYSPSVGFHGSVPIVAATVSIAAGAALAAKMDKSRAVAVAYFGDGACEEGSVHESLNMAAVMKLPILFVCENNLYSSHLDIKLRQPHDSVGRFGVANGVRTEVIDGNDVVAVSRAAGRLIEHARNGEGPGFIEAVTYRWRGHVGPKEDIDVGVRRSMVDLAAWKKRDPVRRLNEALAKRGNPPDGGLDGMTREVAREVEAAVTRARASAYPKQSALLDLVYAAPAR